MNFLEYEQETARAEKAQEWIDERANDYLDGSFNPYTTRNIITALQKMDETDREDLNEMLAETHVDFEEVGKFICSASWSYWEQKATEQAEEDFENEDEGFIEPFDDGYTAEHRAIENWSPRGW